MRYLSFILLLYLPELSPLSFSP